MARHRVSTKGEMGRVPKLEAGDEVPKTGKYRLDEGIRVKPIHGRSKGKSSKQKSYRLKKVKVVGRSRKR